MTTAGGLRARAWSGALRPAVLVAAALTAGSAAHAQEASADSRAEARRLFEAGRARVEAGDCDGAVALFERSRRLYSSAGALYNLALCEERLFRLLSARAYWEQLLSELQPDDPRAVEGRARVAALEQRLPTVIPELPADAPPGSALVLAGELLRTEDLGRERLVDPGPLEVMVRAPGRHPRTVTLRVAEGTRGFRVMGALGPPLRPEAPTSPPTTAATPVTPAEDAPRRRSARSGETGAQGSGAPASSSAPPSQDPEAPPAERRTATAWTLGALGVVGLGVAAVSTTMLLSAKATIEGSCNVEKRCYARGLRAVESVNTWNVLGTVGFVVGVGGVSAWLLLPMVPEPREGDAQHSFVLSARGVW